MKKKLFYLSAFFTCLAFSINAQEQQYTTQGNHTFTVPSSVIGLRVECVGAGGAGGRVTPSNIFDNDASGGGGGGAYSRSILSVNEGDVYDLYVGLGGKNDGTSVDGEDSYFGSSLVLAEGGKTRSGNDNESGAIGGQAGNSIGDIKYTGGNGGNGDESDSDGGGGGGAAGSTGNGSNGSNLLAGGVTAQYGGAGGAGGADGSTGAAGNNYGGGGGGSSANGSNDRNGGRGANGIVVIKWIAIDNLSDYSICITDSETIMITGTNFSNVDSVKLNGKAVNFNVVNTTSIEATIDTSATTGRFIVYAENGIAQSDSLEVIRNTISLVNSQNFLTTTYSGDSLNANWYWYDCVNNDTINTDSTFTLTVDETGVYGVYVEENGCVIQAPCVVVSEIFTPVDTSTQTGLSDIIANESVSLYPNPGKNIVTLQLHNNIVIESINIYDIKGSLVINKQNINNAKIDLNISKLHAGVYMVELINNEQRGIVKLFKE